MRLFLLSIFADCTDGDGLHGENFSLKFSTFLYPAELLQAV